MVDQEFSKKNQARGSGRWKSRSGVQGHSPGLGDKVSKKMKQNLLMSVQFLTFACTKFRIE